MTSLNGLTRHWESFIQNLCSRKENMKFDTVWEYCIQEEARVVNRVYLLREDDHSIATHTKGIKQSKFKKCSHKPSKKNFQNKRVNNQKKDHSKY